MARKYGGWYGVGLHGTLAVLGVLVVLLSRENRQLEGRLEASSREQAFQENLAVGDVLPDLALTRLDGQSAPLSFGASDRDSLLLLFTATCPECQRNVGRWLDLYQQVGERYRVAAIGIDEPDRVRAFAAANELPFDVFVPVEWWRFPETHRIAGVPQTLVVGGDGRIEDLRLGVLRPEFLESFQRSAGPMRAALQAGE